MTHPERAGERSASRRLLDGLRRRVAGGPPKQSRNAASAPGDGGIDQPAEIPPCPPGSHIGPPDFIGVGVQRSGTTRWFDLIRAHPEVAQPPGAKELHYFDRFYAGSYGPSDSEQYHRYFPRSEGQKVGEWTPLYASAPWVPRLLAAAAPEARLLILLRDPVERYLSGLQLDTHVAARRGAPLSRYAPLEAFVRGLYHAQLMRLMAHFERSQLLILQYERCTRDPRTELRRTYEFLGLEDVDFVPDLAAHPRHQPDKPQLDEDTRGAYRQAYRDDVLELMADFPEIDIGLWPNFMDLAGEPPPR